MNAAARIFAWALLALLAVLASLSLVLRDGLIGLRFADPLWGLAGLLPLAAVLVRAWLSPKPPTLKFSRASSLARLRQGWAARLVDLPDGLRVAAAVLLAGALARPQSTRGADRLRHEGIDIVVALDLSESMETPDLPPSRLAAAQAVVDAFIVRRPHDRIGLVVFGSSASTISPLTIDHGVLRKLIRQLTLRTMDGTKTAIGAGLGVSLNRLADSTASTKVIVLLTDGVHNADGLDPDTAAAEAAARGVKIYTILMGQHGIGIDQTIDPARLEKVAATTGGYAYTAADQRSLNGTFQDLLDKLEKTENEGEAVLPEWYAMLLWPALALLLIDMVLRNTRLRRFP